MILIRKVRKFFFFFKIIIKYLILEKTLKYSELN